MFIKSVGPQNFPLIPPVIVWFPVFIICALIAPANLSTALLTGATSLILLFIGRASIKHIGLVVLVAAVPLVMLIGFAKMYYNEAEGKAEPMPSFLTKGRVETWVKRVQNFMYADKTEASYQVQQAKIAIAKGSWVGLGPGNSEARNFLPHPYSDFIYAIIVEEYGMVGGISVLGLYLLLLFRFVVAAHKANSLFGKLVVVGLGFPIIFQAMTNMAVAVELLPVTGQTLPLISSGGTSIWMTCIALGIILSVTKKEEEIAEELAEKQKRDDALQKLIDKQLQEDEAAESNESEQTKQLEDFSIVDTANPMNAVLNKK